MNKKISIIISILILMIKILCLEAQEKWTPEEIILSETILNPIFSPDGNMIIFSKRIGLKKEDKFVTKLFLTRLNVLKDEKPLTIQLTQGTDSEWNPLFSGNGEDIYFLSSRDNGKKLWKLSIYGGEASEVFEFKNGITSIQWLDEQNLAYLSNDGKTLYELNKEENKDNTEIIDDEEHWNPTRVYAFNLKNKEIKRLTDKKKSVVSFTISKNGRYMITIRTMSLSYKYDGQHKPEIRLYDFEKGSSNVVLQQMHLPDNFKFTPNNSGFYFEVQVTSNEKYNGAGKNELYFYDLKNKNVSYVPIEWENGLDREYFPSDDYLFVNLANGPLKKIGLYKKSENNQWIKQKIDFGNMKEHVSLMALNKSGDKLIFNYSTASKMPEFYIADLDINRRSDIDIEKKVVFISLNEKIKKKTIAKSEIIYWIGANDDKINGILYYPKNYEEGKKYPLILLIHGGPAGVSQDSWSESWTSYPQIYTEKGAFVLKPNYHGSSNHGQAFAESISKGDYYALDEIDLYNSVQFLNDKGLIDMDKLGIMGWSNGAILTTWMTLKHPNMFKAAAPGAGDVNWTSDYGTCSFGVTFDQYYFGGAPWDDLNGKHFNEWYINNSPIFDIEKIETPTIIFHGSQDRDVPRDQGWEYYRGLQQVGNAPVKFIWFPDQPHGLQKISHQLKKMNEEIKWFETYLFNTFEPKNESFKENSPLDIALKKVKASKINGIFGIQNNGVLLPQMLSLGKDTIHISLFELTNAQYAAFNSDFQYLAAEANYPVIGLNKNQISEYIKWINLNTNENYRLPNKDEAMKLHKLSNNHVNKENTLNYWAGYEITKDDAIALKKKLLSTKVSLIREVGSFDPQNIGEVLVYDIVGNVAEYYFDGDELKIYGYDAYTFADPYDLTNNESELIGVRLIKD